MTSIGYAHTNEVEITLAGADPTEVGEVEFPNLGGFQLLAVRVVRSSKAGTNYSVGTLNAKFYDEDTGTATPVNIILQRKGKEPDADGVAVFETDVLFGSVIFFSRDSSGKIFVELSRGGGDGTSEEKYDTVIDVERRW